MIDNSKLPPTLPTGIHHRYKTDEDTIYWKNTNISINLGNLFVLIFAFIFTVVFELIFSYQIFKGGLDDWTLIQQVGTLIMYVLFWLLPLGTLSALYSLTWFEAIKISDTHITVIHSGRGASPSKRFSKNIVQEIALGRYNVDGKEVIPSLNILYTHQIMGITGVIREQLANWLSTKEKRKLFFFLQHIMQERGWDIKYRLDYWTFDKSI